MRPRFVLLISLSGTLLAAQGTTFQRPRTRIPEAEKEAIQTLRKGSRPRPVSPRGVLPAVERTRARIFESAKPSVVHVSSSTLARNLLTRDVFSVPAGMGIRNSAWGRSARRTNKLTAAEPSARRSMR